MTATAIAQPAALYVARRWRIDRMPPQEPNTQLWYTLKEAAASMQMEPRQFRQYVQAGVFPRGILRGKKLRLWHRDDIVVMQWIERNRHRLRADKKPPTPPPK